jgi:hypothetical protein
MVVNMGKRNKLFFDLENTEDTPDGIDNTEVIAQELRGMQGYQVWNTGKHFVSGEDENEIASQILSNY